MLASITPLGERGRHARWPVTVSAFVLGATVAGAGVGWLMGAVGSVVLPGSIPEAARIGALVVALAAAVALDLRPGAVPGPRRQVNERWLHELRGWVYGLGFGAQLGLAVTTVISSAATYVCLLAALLTGDAAGGALVLGCFGAVRGLALLAVAHIRHPDQLLAMQARLQRWREPAQRLVLGLETALLALAAVWSLP
ncbi:MAG: hypothetical protein DLM64_01165 [Solirubrobacterales bacterium]|nr:MAG: hypothetical protein DLM64_01165 [Solirubrobacterales bacterium]